MKIVKQTIEIVARKNSICSTYKAIDECGDIHIKRTKSFNNNIEGLENLYKWGEMQGEQFSVTVIYINSTKERLAYRFLKHIINTIKKIVKHSIG